MARCMLAANDVIGYVVSLPPPWRQFAGFAKIEHGSPRAPFDYLQEILECNVARFNKGVGPALATKPAGIQPWDFVWHVDSK